MSDCFEVSESNGTKLSFKRKRKSVDSALDSQKKPKMELSAAAEDRIVEKIANSVNAAFDAKTQALEARLDNIEQSNAANLAAIKEEVKSELSQELQGRGEVGYKLYLAQQIKIAQKNLMVFGMKSANPPDALLALGAKIGIEKTTLDAITIVSWFRLGKPNSETPPICFVFHSEFQRNSFLEKARNLEKGISFDRDIPPLYRAANRRFKEKAKKQKQFLSMLTSIRFVHCSLQLKVRKSRDEGWRILDEYIPSPSAVENTLMSKGNTAEGGGAVSFPSESDLDLAKRTIRVGNFPENKIDMLTAHVSSHVGSPLAKKIGRVTYKNGAATMICDSIKSAKKICNDCISKKVEFENKKLFFGLFD